MRAERSARLRRCRAAGALVASSAAVAGVGALCMRGQRPSWSAPIAFAIAGGATSRPARVDIDGRPRATGSVAAGAASEAGLGSAAAASLAAAAVAVVVARVSRSARVRSGGGASSSSRVRGDVLTARAGGREEGKSMLSGMKGPVNSVKDGEVEGLPWWWEGFFSLPFTARGNPGEELTLGDTMHVFRKNIEQIFGGEESYDGAPLATGDLESAGLTDGTMYLGLQKYKDNFGDVYKLCFGPKSFMVVSDPQILRHILRENVFNYDKGVLGEVLEDVMGKGLIPADFETWKVRRRAIVPGFHKAWLDFQVSEFGRASQLLVQKLKESAAEGKTIDMEERFGSVALDIIGKSVFNYEFGSVEGESPVVKAAIQSLREVEHRAQTPFQYWKLPLMDVLVERQREFKENMVLLNGALNKCIAQALSDRQQADLEELENRDYSKMENPSLLRFLVDMRGEATDGKQLRDDMITMLIAGHETTASALTWALFELAQNPALMKKVQTEIDEVMGDRECPTQEDVKSMEMVRLCFAESLRMYPEPPLLIRRALEEDTLPAGATGKETKVLRGMDFFVSIYNLQRDEKYWPNANTFDPERFKRKYVNPDIPGWAGYDPEKWKGQLYPTETASDYAMLPFGAGPRKCVGDAFAMLEGSVALAMVLRNFDFEFAAPTAQPSEVGTCTGATIHTRNGLWMQLRARR